MKVKNKHVKIQGLFDDGKQFKVGLINAIVTNDDKGKTLTLNSGNIAITIPFEPIEKYLI